MKKLLTLLIAWLLCVPIALQARTIYVDAKSDHPEWQRVWLYEKWGDGENDNTPLFSNQSWTENFPTLASFNNFNCQSGESASCTKIEGTTVYKLEIPDRINSIILYNGFDQAGEDRNIENKTNILVSQTGGTFDPIKDYVEPGGVDNTKWGLTIDGITNWSYADSKKLGEPVNGVTTFSLSNVALTNNQKLAFYTDSNNKYTLGTENEFTFDNDSKSVSNSAMKLNGFQIWWKGDAGNYDISGKIWKDGNDWKADMKFEKSSGDEPVNPGVTTLYGTDPTKICIRGSLWNWNNEGSEAKYPTYDADKNQFIWDLKGDNGVEFKIIYNENWLTANTTLTADIWSANAISNLSGTGNNTKIDGKFDKIILDNATGKVMYTFKPAYTIYFAVTGEAPEAIRNNAASLYVYSYKNGENATQAELFNGNWPGSQSWTYDEAASAAVGLPTYKTVFMNENAMRFIINNDNGKLQTSNLFSVDNGVYVWKDEILPFGIMLKDDAGNLAYRRYANSNPEHETKYIYLPADEFGITDENTPVYVDIFDYDRNEGKGAQVSGLRGTTKALPEYYPKRSAASILELTITTSVSWRK